MGFFGAAGGVAVGWAIAGDGAVVEGNDSVGVLGDVGFVGDDDDGIADGM